MKNKVQATFSKRERLSSKKLINDLFKVGKSVSVFPFRLIWKEIETQIDIPVQLAIAVPKKKIKKAADRNIVKRIIREVYRKNKDIIYMPVSRKEKSIIVMIIYLSNEIPSYKEVEHKIILSLQRLVNVTKL